MKRRFGVTLAVGLGLMLWAGCDYPQSPVPELGGGPDGGFVTTTGKMFQINGTNQICNPSVSRDVANYPGCMMWLGFADLDVTVPDTFAADYSLDVIGVHDRITVTDTGNVVRWFLHRDEVPDITGEIQDPEWGACADYAAFLGKDAGSNWDGYVVRMSDKSVLKFSEDGMIETGTPHIWVGDTAGAVAPPASDGQRLTHGLLPKDSIFAFFDTDQVKIVYSLPGTGLDLWLIDYTEETPAPVQLTRPDIAGAYKMESALISPDGNYVAYNFFLTQLDYSCYAQRLKAGEPANLIASGADPHWFSLGAVDFLVYSTEGGVTPEDLFEATEGTAGRTMLQEVLLVPGGPRYAQFRLEGSPEQLLDRPFKGGLSPDGFYLATGYRWAYMYKFN